MFSTIFMLLKWEKFKKSLSVETHVKVLLHFTPSYSAQFVFLKVFRANIETSLKYFIITIVLWKSYSWIKVGYSNRDKSDQNQRICKKFLLMDKSKKYLCLGVGIVCLKDAKTIWHLEKDSTVCHNHLHLGQYILRD